MCSTNRRMHTGKPATYTHLPALLLHLSPSRLSAGASPAGRLASGVCMLVCCCCGPSSTNVVLLLREGIRGPWRRLLERRRGRAVSGLDGNTHCAALHRAQRSATIFGLLRPQMLHLSGHCLGCRANQGFERKRRQL